MASRHERVVRLTQRQMARGVAAGLTRLRTEDTRFEGPYITVNGQRVIDFGSCSYLGLNRDPRLVKAAHMAVDSYGTAHSSSTMYTSVGLYSGLEDRLRRILGAEVAVAPTTTLAHLAALPVLVGPGDLAIIDKQAHASLHLATTVLRGNGVDVVATDHNDMDALRTKLGDLASTHNTVWYVADGTYSMHGDLAPVAALESMLDDFPNLHLYVDDAHSFGWAGKHGAGHTLAQMDWHPRLVVAAGLSKSFGTTGAFLAFGNPELAERVLLVGAPFTFSGPLQPASLGASIASADIHLSAEHDELRHRLHQRIALARELLVESNLPVADLSETPIWFVKVGSVDDVIAVGRKVLDDGYYVNPSAYPAVALNEGGIRFTQTLHQSEEHLRGLIAALARHVPGHSAYHTDLVVDLREPIGAELAPIKTQV